jgi:peptidoglycan L-alanyl-D-glutamate endopeptidase CwlK
MPRFSKTSERRLRGCHEDLEAIFNAVVQHFDCSILCGHRDKETQDKLKAEGKSQLAWPLSRHNAMPSMAVDVAPYPIDWQDRDRLHYFAGYVMGVAAELRAAGVISCGLRWGGDWNIDTQVKDNRFDDLVHFELVAP